MLLRVTFSDKSGKIYIWLNPHIMMVQVLLNRDSNLDFPKCPHILGSCHSFQCTLFSKELYWLMKLLTADLLLTS